MSYLSLISCTDRGVVWVATKIRSAYSSVSKRETSFSRIALDSVWVLIPLSIRFSDLILGSGGPALFRGRFFSSHDRPQLGLRHAGGPVPGHVEQFRVRLLPVHDDGTVHDIYMEYDVREVLELRGRGALGGHESDDRILCPADGREDAGKLLA